MSLISTDTPTADRLNILMVDDSEQKLTAYEAILAELGENLIKATSAKDALDILLRTDIDLLLLDVKMPEMDGFQLAELVREHPRHGKIPIIFISAFDIADLDRLKGYERGAVDYVSVPVSPELLRAKVSVFSELRRSARQLERKNGQLAALSQRLLAMQDTERRRIARELHDSVGQNLTLIKMTVDNAVRQASLDAMRKILSDAALTVEEAIRQVRSISYLLHPPMLDELGLGSALRSSVEELSKRSGIDMTAEIEPFEFPRLKMQVETAIFRVVQESLANVVRHSEATRAWVLLCAANGSVFASIRDNGKGLSKQIIAFDPAAIGVGISGMKQRVEELGGMLRLESNGSGTIVEIAIPISSSKVASSVKEVRPTQAADA